MGCCCVPHFAGVLLPRKKVVTGVPSVNLINDLVRQRGGNINKELRFSTMWDCPKDVDSYSYVQYGDGEEVKYTFTNKEERYQSGGADFEVMLDVDNTYGNKYGEAAVENRTFDGLPATGLTTIEFTLHDYSGGGAVIRRSPEHWSDGLTRDDFIGVPFGCDVFVAIEHRNIPAGEAPFSHYALIKMPNLGGQEVREDAGTVVTAFKCNGEYSFMLGGEYVVNVDTGDDHEETRRPEIVKSHGIKWVDAPPVCG